MMYYTSNEILAARHYYSQFGHDKPGIVGCMRKALMTILRKDPVSQDFAGLRRKDGTPVCLMRAGDNILNQSAYSEWTANLQRQSLM